MKNIKNYLLSFILGGIIFSGLTVFAEYVITADKIEYSANTSVKDKIDDLYTKVKPNYTGNTEVTPSNSTQILYTNNKILNSNITINAVPSNYKVLNTLTDVSANNLLNGVKAYTNDGTLIIGTISTDCVKGTYTKSANSQLSIDLTFVPTKFEMYFVNAGVGDKMLIVYDQSIGSFYQIRHEANNNYAPSFETEPRYAINGKNVYSNYNATGTTYQTKLTYYYVACK